MQILAIYIDGIGLYYENLTDRIGIGTADPTHKLTVNGRTQSLGLDLDGEDYFNNGAGVDDGVIRSISEISADLIFISNDNIRFDLDENGGEAGEFEIFNSQNVKVLNVEETGGMTVTGAKMRLTNEAESKSIEFRTTGGAVDIDALNADLFLTADGSNDIVLQAIAGSVGIGTTTPSYLLHVDGTAGKPGGGSWSNSSDRRLKKDIKSFDLGLKAIDAVNPVFYHYNGRDNLPTDKEYVGVIAQELQKIAPFMVSEYVGADNETYLAVDPSAFDFILINAIKELKAEIEILKRERDDK